MDEKPSLPRRSKSAATFLTYVRERMDTFLDRPLCAIDSLVFSWLAYAHLGEDQVNACLPEGIALHEMLRAEEFDNMFGSTWDPEGSRDLLFAVCASPAFSRCPPYGVSLQDRPLRRGAVRGHDVHSARWQLLRGVSRYRFHHCGLEGRLQHDLPQPRARPGGGARLP